jgi:MoaA/NifB/PqqE/SkfB family radical SAM enzyme
MSMSLFERIISEVYATVHTMQFYFQGEPLLNRQLPEMIAKAHQVGLYTIVSTNAQSLTCSTAEALVKSGLNRIIVSIDGFSEESYAAYRVGGSLQRALEGLRQLSNAKAKYDSRIRIELQVLRLKTNEHEWQWIRKHYKQLGATHLVFKTAQLYDYEHGHALMPSQAKYSRYRLTKDGTYRLHASWLRRHWVNTPCYRLWSGFVVTTTGQVLPCCYDKAAQHALGTLAQSTFVDIWFGKKADDFRGSVLREGNRIAICQACHH